MPTNVRVGFDVAIDSVRVALLLCVLVVRVWSVWIARAIGTAIRDAIRVFFDKAVTAAADTGWIKLRIGLRMVGTTEPVDNRFLVIIFVLMNSSAMARRVRWTGDAAVSGTFTTSFGTGNLVRFAGEAIVFFIGEIKTRAVFRRTDRSVCGDLATAATTMGVRRLLSADFGDKIRFLFVRSGDAATCGGDGGDFDTTVFERLVEIVVCIADVVLVEFITAVTAVGAAISGVLIVDETIWWFSFDDPDEAGELGVLWLFPSFVGVFANDDLAAIVGDLLTVAMGSAVRFGRAGESASDVSMN